MSTNKKIKLENLAAEILSKIINDDVDSIEFELWEKVETKSKIILTWDEIIFYLRGRVKTKKLLVWIGGLISFVIVIANILAWCIPIIEDYYNKGSPLP